jgi:hypothetical protein
VTGAVTYSVKVITQDDILRQLRIDRNSYFSTAAQDQGHGFDLKNGGSLMFGILYGQTHHDDSFGIRWPGWDASNNSGWGWTWPFKIFN